MDKERKRKEKNAYMTLEACFIMPITVILTAFLLILTFYLYTVCFLNQAAYIAAFRASLTDGAGYEREAKAEEELEKLLAEALIRLPETQKEIEASSFRVTVTPEDRMVTARAGCSAGGSGKPADRGQQGGSCEGRTRFYPGNEKAGTDRGGRLRAAEWRGK